MIDFGREKIQQRLRRQRGTNRAVAWQQQMDMLFDRDTAMRASRHGYTALPQLRHGSPMPGA